MTDSHRMFVVPDSACITVDGGGGGHRRSATLSGPALRRQIAASRLHLETVEPRPAVIDVRGRLSLDLLASWLAALQLDVVARLGFRDCDGVADPATILTVCSSDDDAVPGQVVYLDQIPTDCGPLETEPVIRAATRLPFDRADYDVATLSMVVQQRSTPDSSRRLDGDGAAGEVSFAHFPWATTITMIDELIVPLLAGSHVVISESHAGGRRLGGQRHRSAESRENARPTGSLGGWPPHTGRALAVDLLEDRISYGIRQPAQRA